MQLILAEQDHECAANIRTMIVQLILAEGDHVSAAIGASVSPECISEDKPAELHVSQNDSMLVTVGHSTQHLSEETPRLVFTQLFPASHVHVHVTVVGRQEGIHPILTDHRVQEAADVVMVTDSVIGSQTFLVTPQGKNLERWYTVSYTHTPVSLHMLYL